MKNVKIKVESGIKSDIKSAIDLAVELFICAYEDDRLVIRYGYKPIELSEVNAIEGMIAEIMGKELELCLTELAAGRRLLGNKA